MSNGVVDPASDAMGLPVTDRKVEFGEAGYVFEDVPHLSNYIPDLPVAICRIVFLSYVITFSFALVSVIF